MTDDVYLGKDRRIETLALCPYCKCGPLDSCIGLKIGERPRRDNMPKVGDLTVCAYCGAILAFVQDGVCLALRLADGKQLAKLRKNKRVFRVVRALVDGIRRDRPLSEDGGSR